MKIWTFFQKFKLEPWEKHSLHENCMPIPAVRTPRRSEDLQMNSHEFPYTHLYIFVYIKKERKKRKSSRESLNGGRSARDSHQAHGNEKQTPKKHRRRYRNAPKNPKKGQRRPKKLIKNLVLSESASHCWWPLSGPPQYPPREHLNGTFGTFSLYCLEYSEN